MKEELDALHKTGTWDLVNLPSRKTAIGCKWVYKIKTRSDGTFDHYKARLVAGGFALMALLFFVKTLIAVSADGSQMATLSYGCKKCFS